MELYNDFKPVLDAHWGVVCDEDVRYIARYPIRFINELKLCFNFFLSYFSQAVYGPTRYLYL